MVDKAIDVAVQERARYFADRIARTEKARAYMDGVMYQYAHDPDCVAFKWKLSSRHPCDDICDMYARADLWGMGEGIFQNGCWYHAGKAPMALKRRGVVIFWYSKAYGGAIKREIMIRLQDQILRVFLYFSIRKPSISVIIIAI